ncbi:MAG TPA: YdiU family protein [Humisphaera sp.]
MSTRLTDLPWDARFVRSFPGDAETRNFTRQVRNVLYSEVRPTPVSAPRLLAWADGFANELGIERPAETGDDPSLGLLAGNHVPAGMRPYAARYGGHQFGSWAGQLGDGRAITLGEVGFRGSPHGRLEFQLKGAGRTPYSRHADGRAVLRSSLREFLCSEAMHALGVPTTRALSLVATGEPVVRDMFYDGNPRPEPGAVVCRVAPTFLRFGNFEILAASEELGLLKRLTDFTVEQFFPAIDPKEPDAYGQLLDEVARRTAEMVVGWRRVGFVHGVMNTDNMSILGVTIDYGPYGWLEPYDPDWTPNTTDAGTGRYRFGNQPAVAMWNLSALAGALLPLIGDEDRARRSLDLYRTTYQRADDAMMAAKLGLSGVESDDDQKLVADLASLLRAVETDYTLFFRGLCDWPAKAAGEGVAGFFERTAPAFYADPPAAVSDRWADWAKRYAGRVGREPSSDAERSAAMRRVNPKYVPRNYLAQQAITAAEEGDATVLDRLMRVLRKPYEDQPGEEDLAGRRPEWARSAPGCSALSCSS